MVKKHVILKLIWGVLLSVLILSIGAGLFGLHVGKVALVKNQAIMHPSNEGYELLTLVQSAYPVDSAKSTDVTVFLSVDGKAYFVDSKDVMNLKYGVIDNNHVLFLLP